MAARVLALFPVSFVLHQASANNPVMGAKPGVRPNRAEFAPAAQPPAISMPDAAPRSFNWIPV
jgi:hypothetical protein